MSWRDYRICSGLLALILLEPGVGFGAGVFWRVEARIPEMKGWRLRIDEGTADDLWLGACHRSRDSQELLYHRIEGRWQPVEVPSPVPACGFVFDVDPSGQIWMGRYAQSAEVYDKAWIGRFDGDTWHRESLPVGIWMQAIAMPSPEEGWIGGNRGRMLHLEDGEWRRQDLELEPGAAQVDVLDLYMSSTSEGWGVGNPGLVIRYEASAWQLVEVPEIMRERNLSAVEVDAAGRVWVGGSSGLIAVLQEATWTVLHSQGADILDLAMAPAGDGWAVGVSGTILRFDGETWHPHPSPTTVALMAVHLDSSHRGWIAGEGVILGMTSEMPLAFTERVHRGRFPMARQNVGWAAAADFDRDDRLDLATLAGSTVHIFVNDGQGGFAERESMTLPAAVGFGDPMGLGLALGDLDGDDRLDLVLTSETPAAAHLAFNRGDGRFHPLVSLPFAIPEGREMLPHLVDLDGDGPLDLVFSRGDGPRIPRQELAFRNLGNGRFRPAGRLLPAENEKSMLWGDLDSDGDLDVVLLAYLGDDTRLFLGDGRGGWTEATRSSGLDRLGNGHFLQLGLIDLDVDGDLDLLLQGSRLQLMLNDGFAHFSADSDLLPSLLSDPGARKFLSAAGDLDHDGRPEILLESRLSGKRRMHLLHRSSSGPYRDIAPQLGLEGLLGDSAVLADWDDDGDLDLFIGSIEGDGHWLENRREETWSRPDFLKVRLRGRPDNRWAVGSRVRIYNTGHAGDPAFLRGHQQTAPGFNTNGSSILGELHFGVAAGGAFDVVVDFPGGRRVSRPGVDAGRVVTVYELPFPKRQWMNAAVGLRRRVALVEPMTEGLKLVLVVLILGLWPVARGSSGALGGLVSHRWLRLCLLAAYGAAVLAWPTHGSLGKHTAQVLAVVALLLGSDLAGRSLTRWRETRHLGPYRLGEVLGEGGMGVVYRARHLERRQDVALKVLHSHWSKSEIHQLRLVREAEILAQVRHPAIVRILEAGQVGGRAFIAMELFHGQTLKFFLQHHGPFAPELLLSWFVPLCDALGALHLQGIVHCDVKSENLFLVAGETGSEPKLKLMDFGLARDLESLTVTSLRNVVGTVAYMAPEQLRGERATPASDLYSLGMVLYECSSGRLPFVGATDLDVLRAMLQEPPTQLGEIRPDLPSALCRLVMLLLAVEPEQRPASAGEVGDALRWCLEPASEPGPVETRSAFGEQGTTGSEQEALPQWLGLFHEARSELAAGRYSRAQILVLDCLTELRGALAGMSAAESATYSEKYPVAEAVEFSRRWNS